MDIFGVKLDFKNTEDKLSSTVKDTNFKNPSLKDYKIKFTETALSNISSLNITEDTVVQLVQREFTHHVNYFHWDLQDYPLPVQLNYIVVMDKIENSITFRAIKRADFNEVQLASINGLLATYRRLTRYEYRKNNNYILRPEVVESIADAHYEMIRRLLRHYEIFKGVELPGGHGSSGDFFQVALDLAMRNRRQSNDDRLRNLVEKSPKMIKGFAYNVFAATSALHEIDRIIADEKNRLISQDIADREIVVSLEGSLQHIHKMITSLFE